jgi:hypothetical protein
MLRPVQPRCRAAVSDFGRIRRILRNSHAADYYTAVPFREFRRCVQAMAHSWRSGGWSSQIKTKLARWFWCPGRHAPGS